jgi:hypothetical protein
MHGIDGIAAKFQNVILSLGPWWFREYFLSLE